MPTTSFNGTVVRRLLWARGLRAFADGFVSLLLPVYLISLGLDAFQVGIVATTTLVGSGVMTFFVGFQSHRWHYRTWLIAAALLMTATGLSFAVVRDLWPLLVIAFVGTLNPSSGGVSVFLPLEHAVITHAVADRERTAAFARYGLVGSLVGALGALFAAVPELLSANTGIDPRAALQAMFVVYAGLGLAAAAIYATLPDESATDAPRARSSLTTSRTMVYKLAALFCIDSFAGGLLVDSMLLLWLFQRFELSPAVAGPIFFWSGVLAAFSMLAAVRIARRIGLINTMVFTHIPSSVLLILVPFMPSLGWAVALLLARAALSQMDVPTRTSYVMAIVPPEERPAAASMTSVPRSFAAAFGPVIAGYLLTWSSFGWPLIITGVLKITYDLLLLYTCRNVKPPEESA